MICKYYTAYHLLFPGLFLTLLFTYSTCSINNTQDVSIFGDLSFMEKNMSINDFTNTKQTVNDPRVIDIVNDFTDNTQEANDSRVMDIFDDIDLLEESMAIDGFLDTVSFDEMPTRAIEVRSILGLLEDVGAFTILDQDFYRRTNPFVQRNILDLPLWELHSCAEPNRWIFGAHLFWNHMDRSVFICKNTNICSYLDLDQTTLFAKLDELSPFIKASFPNASIIEDVLDTTTITRLISLFRNFTAQQRRIGIMLHAWRQWNRLELRMLLPFYYIQRNIFARPAEQSAIEAQFGAIDADEQEAFEKNHAISDKVGFGDFRLELDYAFYKSDTFAFRAGGLITLPIAFAVSKEIKGTSFSDCTDQPTFNLQSLFDLIPEDFDPDSVTDEDKQTAKEIIIGDICKNKNGLLLGALDRLHAILLDTKLGNNQHLGIGLFLRSRTSLSSLLDEFDWAARISFNNRLSVEYLAPAIETRFFIRRNLASDFSARDFTSDNEIIQEDNLQFIQTEIVNKFYPFAIKTRIQPGAILRWTSRWCFSGKVWDLSIGSDIWIQTQESFKSFKCADQALLNRLDITNGKTDFAYQFKTVASLGFKFERPTYSVLVGINAEGTSWNRWIGDDITVSVNLEVNF